MLLFADFLGIAIVSADRDAVVAALAWTPERCTPAEVMHGGALMSVADTAGGILAYANLPDRATGTSTISSSTQFTRGLRDGQATATARLLHRGRSTIVVETDIRDGDERLLAYPDSKYALWLSVPPLKATPARRADRHPHRP